MRIDDVSIALINASGRLRPINQDWVETLAEAVRSGDDVPPITIVEKGASYRLIAGGHRLAAHAFVGRETIRAQIFTADEMATEAAIRLAEIRENMLRYELTALDRAVHLAAWKEIHEGVAGPAKRGRKAKPQSDELRQDPAAMFAGTFSAAAARALRISERSIRVAVQVATSITPVIRERIAAHPIADNMTELLLLAGEDAKRQEAIVGLLLSDPPAASTVADAIAILDRTPAPQKLAGWERLSDKFGRLKEGEQHRFFEANADAIDTWLATRRRAAA